MKDEKENTRVNRIAEDGQKRYDVQGVPAVIVDGAIVPPDERDWSHLQARIDGLLASHRKKR